jgi:hypothetical protein
VLSVIAAALVIIAVQPWLSKAVEVVMPATADAQSIGAQYEVTVPRSWGRLVSFSDKRLLLEAPDQSLRIVEVDGRAPEYPKVKVLIRWQ